VLKSRVLLLQLMQNCFPMLPNPLEPRDTEESTGLEEGSSAVAGPSTSSSGEPLGDSRKAVSDLYTHLCHRKNLPAFTQHEAVFGLKVTVDVNNSVFHSHPLDNLPGMSYMWGPCNAFIPNQSHLYYRALFYRVHHVSHL